MRLAKCREYPYTVESTVLKVRSMVLAGEMVLEQGKKIIKEENYANARFELRQNTGNAGHEIVRLAKEGGFSLIVMHARGHTASTYLLMGSVNDMVVHHAPCPVLIVR